MTRFLHFADCHLGYKQYNHKERFNDFARAFLDVIDRAIDAQVDFVILAGDLFQKRAIDALTLNQAMVGLERLERAAIPCIAVEGNHEHAYYQDAVGWMEFLAQRRLLILLDAEFADGAPLLTPYSATRRRGAYIDPVPGVRVYGMRYYGAGTPAAVEAYAAALREQPSVQENGDPVDYTIFIAHGGVEGVLADEAGGLSVRQWSALKPYVDYLALGHIHKPYQFDDWIFNPGSTETCSISEAEWRERGYYLVEIDPADADERRHAVTLHANRRRPFFRFSYKVDHDQSPTELESKAGEFLLRKARDLRVDRLADDARPVVDLQLTGVLPFDRGALRLDLLETMAWDAFNPLHVLIKNHTRSAEFAIDADETLSRTQLERRVLADLLARDQRFAGKSDDWARLAVTLKQMALTGAGADAVLEEISGAIQ
ncbi:MAG: exonuclease SbcCD subunit D [Caldilineaceae bacterium]|nr:exonuclease SbcCD subunit D [Caldilineaceae bacterium]